MSDKQAQETAAIYRTEAEARQSAPDEAVLQGAASQGTVKLPPYLQSGDRLTRLEFERRYGAMPRQKKAELIEGVVYMSSPVSAQHATPHAFCMGWLAVYAAITSGVGIMDNATVRLDPDNEVQPDALLWRDVAQDGQAHIEADGYLAGAPELVVEIALSSAAYDLYDKMHVYRRAGVQEYVVWQIHEERIDWFHLHEGRYLPLDAEPDGLLHSRVMPGLVLDAQAMLEGRLGAVLARQQAELQKLAPAPQGETNGESHGAAV